MQDDANTLWQVIVDGEVWCTLNYKEQADRAMSLCKRDAWFAKAAKFEVLPISREDYEAQQRERLGRIKARYLRPVK